MVQLSDYQVGLDNQVMFGGQTSIEDLENLNKSLAAGSITGRDTTNMTGASGSPLKVESLEKQLKVLTYTDKQMVFWKNIPKAPAFNTVEEYNQMKSYGQERGGFNAEGELPVEEDSTYVRRAQLVKFAGVTKSVTHPMTLVNTMIGSAIEKEAKNGTLWILQKIDRALFSGDESIIKEEFNGILTQHRQNDDFATLDQYFDSDVVVDMRGAPLSEDAIESSANGIIENFGIGNSLYAPPKVLSDFVKNFYGNKFIQPNTEALTNGTMGQKVKNFESQFGDIALNWDIFFNMPQPKAYNAGANSNVAPPAITPDGSTPVAAVGATVPGTRFATADAGTYYYGIVPLNRYGDGPMTVLSSSAVTVAAGGAVDLKFAPGSGVNPATGFAVYRSQKGAANSTTGSKYQFLFAIGLSQLSNGFDGGAASVVRDRNFWLPGTNQAFLIQEDTEVLEFKQLAPLMKMDLAVTSPAYRFMVLLYGTPFLYAPKKMVRIVNIGLRPLAAVA